MSHYSGNPSHRRGSHHEPEYESVPGSPQPRRGSHHESHHESEYESTAGSPRYRRGSHHEPEYESAPGSPRPRRGSYHEPGYESTAGSPRYRRGSHHEHDPMPQVSEEEHDERELRFAKDLISESPHNHLLWKEELVHEYESQLKMMIAQNYAEKCQKFVFDQLLQLRKEAKGVSCHTWGSEMESRIETIIRLVPYVERARKQAEFRFSLAYDQNLDSVMVRERQLQRSLVIDSDCVELGKGVAAAKTQRLG